MNTHYEATVAALKAIIDSAQNCLDALYSDQFKYKHAEDSMNYIRITTQKVQLHMKDFENEQAANN